MSFNPDDSVVDVPGGDGQEMTVGEMEEALKDESHPRHAEAVQWNEELAKQLRPAMEALQKTFVRRHDLNQIMSQIASAVNEEPVKFSV